MSKIRVRDSIIAFLERLVGAKHSDRISMVSAIGYHPNASPLRLMNRCSSQRLGTSISTVTCPQSPVT
ncbi:hypothetical protein PN497_10985 [Sphaerospermopsis kisseleviana CS-549]|uniref:Uncharacterized protein n=1 Tax=Sphaerospermopsis kisseleviana CS-549 TaxID=3021783 RepID=A0ABT4ZRU4_9CYAN|nr:hypothetical protein [Sphaerospermopsis kisseleviana]MDB9441881.1 hypothetical protein [Sphaerospermopsis kisseleviana CS-549]